MKAILRLFKAFNIRIYKAFAIHHRPLAPFLKPYDLKVMVAAVLLLGTADTIGRLAVLRHSDAVTAASLDAGLSPLASVMAHSTRGLAIHEGSTAGARQGEMAETW